MNAFVAVGGVKDALSAETEYFQEKFLVPKPSQDTDVIFYCRSGRRSQLAIKIANNLGFYKCVRN